METPHKSSRRKLKKVLKKSKTNLSLSTHNMYQKKLKSAINVSLNSTRMVRSLQTNNRSLAASLEKMRQDFRQVHDHYTLLLEENFGLRQKVRELERVDFSDKIEQEVNKRFEEHIDVVKKKLAILRSQTTGFLDTFTELTDIFYSIKTASEDVCTTDLSSLEHSPCANAQSTSQDVSVEDTPYCEPAKSCHRPGQEVEADGANKTDLTHEATLVMEQSFLCSSVESSTTASYKFETVSKSALSDSGKPTVSRLPMRIPKQTREPTKWNNGQVKVIMNKLSKNMSDETAEKVCRRETFIITSHEPPDEVLLSEIVMPQFLVSDSYAAENVLDLDEDGLSQADDETGVSCFLSPTRLRQPWKKSPEMLSSLRSRQISPRKKASPVALEFTDIRTPTGSSPECRVASPASGKKTRLSLQKGCSSKPRQISPKKKQSPSTSNEKQMMVKTFPQCQKPLAHMKNKKSKLTRVARKISPKHFMRSRNKQKDMFFISNEFDLVNVHKQRLVKTIQRPDCAAIATDGQFNQEGEHTIFPEDDMELTMSMEVDSQVASDRPLMEGIYVCDSSSRSGDGSEANSPIRQSRSKHKQIEEAINDVEEQREEKVPDAVTMRFHRPGRFTFAASRKESDGTRKSVPVIIPKARSKSKKQIADMIENLPQTEPESIFDFHDKTPVALSSEKQKVSSAFNLSSDESSLSPKLPLDKNRSRSRNTKKTSEQSKQRASQSEGVNSKVKAYTLLNDGCTFEVPLNDTSPTVKSTYRTRSHSRSRKQTDSENNSDETFASSQSGKKPNQTKVGTRDLVKAPGSPVVRSGRQSNNLTSPKTVELKSRLSGNKEITSEDGDNKICMTLKYSNLDAVCKEGELDFDSSKGIRAEVDENIQEMIYSPKGPYHKTRSRTRNREKKKEQLRKDQPEETINDTSVSATVGSAPDISEKGEKSHVVSHDSGSEHLETKSLTDEMQFPSSSLISYPQDSSDFTSGMVMEETALQSTSPEGLANSQLTDCKDIRSTETTRDISGLKSSESVPAEALSGAELKRKQMRSKSTLKRARETSPPVSTEALEGSSSLSDSANFVSYRVDRTKGSKGERKACEELEARSRGKSAEVSDIGLAANGDFVAHQKLSALKDSREGEDVEVCEKDSSQLLEQLKHLRTPVLSRSEEVVQITTSTASGDTHSTPEGKKQVPRMSKIVRVKPLNRLISLTEGSALVNSPKSLAALHGKRRAATKVNYAEMPLNAKLRRGDPFTSHYCTTDKIDIFKSPKSKVKKKVARREVLGSLHNISIQEELLTTEETSQVSD